MGYMDDWEKARSIEQLKGKTLTKCEQRGDDEIWFECDDRKQFRMYHDQDCCEGVSIESVVGDLADLVGNPILVAEESTNRESHPKGVKHEYTPESFTWTFYKLATIKGHVDIRWYGSSNGYYSESVQVVEVQP